jgi:hypothetical protein
MASTQNLVHIAVESVLAALVWALSRRASACRRRMIVLETAQELMKKKFEAATAGLHLRLLWLERQCRQSPARPRPDAAGWQAELAKALESEPDGKPARPPQDKRRLSRGELELQEKIRRLGIVKDV